MDPVDREKDRGLPEGNLLRLNESSHIASWALAIGVSLLGLMFLVTNGSPSQNSDGSLLPVLGLVWLGFGLMIAAEARSGLIVRKDGIVVQGWLRRRDWAWSEIEEFTRKFFPTVTKNPPQRVTHDCLTRIWGSVCC